jgi:hypothetical protein
MQYNLRVHYSSQDGELKLNTASTFANANNLLGVCEMIIKSGNIEELEMRDS